LTSDNKSKITIKEVFGYFVSLILTAIFLYLAFHGEDVKNLITIIGQASLWWIIVFAFLTVLGHYLRALRWKIILSSIKNETSLSNLFGSVMIGYGINNVIPRLGEVSRAVAVGKLENISRSSVLGTIVVERVIDIIFFGIAVVLSAFIYSGNIYEEFVWLKPTIYLGTIIIISVIVIIILTIRFKENFYKVVLKIVEKFSELFAHKLAGIFEKLILGFSSLRGTKNYFNTFLLSVLIIFSYWVNTYVGLLMLGMEANISITFTSSLVIMSISSIGVMIPTPGGIGSYHSITKTVLVTLYNYERSIGIAFATLTHGISYIIHTLCAIIYFFIFKKKFATIQKDLFKIDEQ
jgi:hypothetical protein